MKAKKISSPATDADPVQVERALNDKKALLGFDFAKRLEYDPFVGILSINGHVITKKKVGEQKALLAAGGKQNDIFEYQGVIIRVYKFKGIPRQAQVEIFQDLAKEDITPKVIEYGFIKNDMTDHYFTIVEKIYGETLEEKAAGNKLSDSEMTDFLFLLKKLIDRGCFIRDFILEQFMVGHKENGEKGVWLVDPDEVKYQMEDDIFFSHQYTKFDSATI